MFPSFEVYIQRPGGIRIRFRYSLIRGLALKPQFLKAGDVVTPGIERPGERRQKIVAAKK